MNIKPAPYHDLLRVMTVEDPQDPAPPGCPICKLVHRGLLAYLDDLVYSCGVDPQVRRELRLGRGLCNRHAHLFLEVVGLALGVTLINWDVLDSINEALGEVGGTGAGRRSLNANRLLRRLVPPGLRRERDRLTAALRAQRPCMACEHQASIEKIYISTLLEHVQDAALQPALRSSPGLCLPHYEQAVKWAPDAGTLETITNIERGRLAALSAELQELARKYDHRYQHEAVGPEGDSWKRSIDIITAARGVR